MKKHKILILSDLGDSTTSTLKGGISLSKIINGDLTLFSVKRPTDIVEKANQLSAMRAINKEHTLTDNHIQEILKPLNDAYDADIGYSFAFGNVKNEIGDFIEKNRPDIIVLGKRKAKPFSLFGDGITQYILKTFKGPVMIANNKDVMEPHKELSLGILNGFDVSRHLSFADDLLGQTHKTIKSYKILKNTMTLKEAETSRQKNIVEYVFEYNDSTVKTLSNYLAKGKVDLLFFERAKNDMEKSTNYSMPNIKDIVENLDVSLLIAGEAKYDLANQN